MKPLPHQQRVSDELDDQTGVLAYHGLGSGKGFTAINAAQQHHLPLLAIMPASLRDNFRGQIAKAGFKGPARVMSYEEAVKLKDDPAFLRQAAGSLLAVDEAANLGRSESTRSELLKIPAARKLFLSGTPARNGPEELAPLLNGLGADLPLGRAFLDRFTEQKEVGPGLMGRLRGMKPGSETVARNLDEFRQAIKGRVDYHPSGTRDFPETREQDIAVPMTEEQTAAYRVLMGRDPQLAYKVLHGIPPSKADLTRFQAFSSGPRQVVNDARVFNSSATADDAPKIQRAAQEILKQIRKNPQYRGLSYSNYLEAGAQPLQAALEKAGVRSSIYSGAASMGKRKQMVEDYNKGLLQQLIVTGAGSEGLDLKGTRLVQLLEPHWHEARPDQVIGRAVRYQSHSGLPARDRNVLIQRFRAVNRNEPGWLGRLFGYRAEDRPTIDGYLYDMAARKQRLTDQFLAVMREKQKG